MIKSKEYLLLLTILLSLNFVSRSQTSDTICFPVETVKKVLIAAEQKKVLDGQVILLNERIANLQTIITGLQDKDSLTVQGYALQIKSLLEEKALYKDQLNTYEKLLRRERRKRRLVTAAGIATTGLAIFLSIQK